MSRRARPGRAPRPLPARRRLAAAGLLLAAAIACAGPLLAAPPEGEAGAAASPALADPRRAARALEAAERELQAFLEEDAEQGTPGLERAPERARAAIESARLPWVGDRLAGLPHDASEDDRRVAAEETLRRVRAAREEALAAPGPRPPSAPAAGPSAGAATAPAPPEPREVVRAVLAERQFREHLAPEESGAPDGAVVGDTIGSWWQWIQNRVEALWKGKEEDEESWLREWLGGVLKPVGELLKELPWTAITVAILIAVGLWLAVLVARHLRIPAVALGRRGAGGPNPLIADAMRHEARHFLGEGDRLLERGDLRGAVRAYYVGILSALHHRRLLKLEPSETNWEHVARLRTDVDLQSKVVPPTRLFDHAWYGRLPVDRERVLALARTLEELSGPEATAAAGDGGAVAARAEGAA